MRLSFNQQHDSLDLEVQRVVADLFVQIIAQLHAQ